ncbi:uncharacterized protein RCC_02388 [Ramularia collo-cygni]|uniref:Tudor domain-containing protein n=1 Tax=Ramularia collo-cygni TaxID=112498 RepID=A0A2D3V248_9PEZI|nr:uncharacterized protein RCC_02388 [Ramularia collo-cygni]CZT16554.1 uncharacterized protein RCC_02388 [Ramularia collo-cygni]
MASIQALQEELAGHQSDLEACLQAIASDPTDTDLVQMKDLVQQQIATTEAEIDLLKRAQSVPPPPPAPKFDMSKHPKYQKGLPEDGPPPPPPEESYTAVFNTGDSVVAKYSADKQWYPGTIISKTGSTADPVYVVSFTGYSEKETKRKHEVRAAENKKRKAEGSLSATAPPAPSSPVVIGNVTSGAASIDPTLVQQREPSKVSDGPTRMQPAPKKLKGAKALEKNKSSWGDWQKNGPKKAIVGAPSKKLAKDSMFRTPDMANLNAKVGITGSGKPMSKDVQRQKYVYGRDEPED